MALGQIILEDGRKAVLNDKGDWECDDPDTLEDLQVMFSIQDKDYSGPSAGPRGALLLRDAAKELGGKMEYLAKVSEKSDPDVVY